MSTFILYLSKKIYKFRKVAVNIDCWYSFVKFGLDAQKYKVHKQNNKSLSTYFYFVDFMFLLVNFFWKTKIFCSSFIFKLFFWKKDFFQNFPSSCQFNASSLVSRRIISYQRCKNILKRKFFTIEFHFNYCHYF